MNYGGVNINVYSQPGQDIDELANVIMRKMQITVDRRLATWGA